MSILLGILTFGLILVSVFLILVVLAQKTKDGGMGAALGGGATESAFGHETGNVLTKATIYATVAFFVLSFVLYLGQIYKKNHHRAADGPSLPDAPSMPSSPPAAGTTTSSLKLPMLGATTSPTPAPAASVTLPATATASPAAAPSPATAPKPATP